MTDQHHDEPQTEYMATESKDSSSSGTSQKEGEGGPLWRLAGIMTGTQSRADPDAVAKGGSMVYVGETDEEKNFLKSSATAQKRVKMVQLLIVGLVGLMLGGLGNIFVNTSCHFVNVPVQAGQNQGTVQMHYGLFKYSSVGWTEGYKYCLPYSETHDSEVPLVARIANILALVLGTYSLVVLWWYLVTGNAHSFWWGLGVWVALLAAASQMMTLSFFFDTICQEGDCSWGPASFFTIGASVAWILLAFELYYQAPYTTEKRVNNIETVEMPSYAPPDL